MLGDSDPEAFKGKSRHSRASSWPRSRHWLRLAAYYKPRSPRRALLLIVVGLLTIVFLVVHLKDAFRDTPMGRKQRQRLKDLVAIDDTWRDLNLDIPPRYLDVYEAERRLPQHNLSLPYPEGANGRYVKFTSQINMLGWNNVLNELLMLNHLAYKSKRAYVFQQYIWKWEYHPWPRSKAWDWHPHTPLSALIGGPTTGDGWPADDPAPRSVNEDYWDLVCPPSKVRVIWTHHIKTEYNLRWTPNAKQVFDAWNKVLLGDAAQCIEVIAPQRDIEDFSQVFELWLWGSERILGMWEELRDSPVSQLLRTSPIIERNIARNEHLFWSNKTTELDPFKHVFAAHVRRGDYDEACLNLANWKSTFYGWNQLPWLPDRFVTPEGGEPGKNTPENIKKYYERCLPEPDTIIKRINDARDDYEKEVFGEVRKDHYVHTLYILTNEKGEWMDKFKERLQRNNDWRIVTSSDLVHGSSQEKDVAMATDMDLARRSAIFLGNGWSSFTSNILHRRLVEKKIPITNRFF